MSADIIGVRRERTSEVLDQVGRAFLEELGAERARVIGTHTTVYVTGSGGRGDMGAASDLDPYVVRLGATASPSEVEHAENAIAAAMREAVEGAGLPELDAGGEHARLVTARSLIENLGSPKDDAKGAFTKRMLLLLESRPLINRDAYNDLIAQAIDAYWKNEGEHPDDYLPIILVNDIVRYWRIVLLNHESRLLEKSRRASLTPQKELALRRYSSYKLRVPRCLSCFSALAYLLARTPTEPAHVTRDDIIRMVRMTPIERLEDLRTSSSAPPETLDALRRLYVEYLDATDSGKTVLTDQLETDLSKVKAVSRDGREFTRHMFDLVQALGGGRPLHRAIVV